MSGRRVEDLHLYFQPIVREVLLRAHSKGLHAFITQGKRSREYQACLYARGRVKVGQNGYFDDLVVSTFLSKDKKNVVARCGTAEYVAPLAGWHKQVTRVLWSWHVVGFAVDFSFRSEKNATDDLIAKLEAAKNWREIERLYTALDAIWREVCPASRWGNDWDQDGVPIKSDATERGALVDLPHWEWHPGKTLTEVRSGVLPPYPIQCPRCRNFAAAFEQRPDGQVCSSCVESESRPRCVGVR